MAKKTTSKKSVETTEYRHTDDTRPNIPTAQMAAEGTVPKAKKARYAYSPHLPPVLRFDETGRADRVSVRVEELLHKATESRLTPEEASELREAIRHYQPWLEWAGKREEVGRGMFEVDSAALYIHERLSAQACIRAAMRADVQRSLFADPEQSYSQAVQFYRHDVSWANRLILGDSLQVMASLAQRESLAGKVQMIYIDPPYGIRFASNFQPEVGKRDVKDKDDDLTRELETVKAFRDTWELGVHSYLRYLQQRLSIARELLSATGSIFVQIGEDNVHLVRSALDDIFGVENFCAEIAFRKTSGIESAHLASSKDWLIWYFKDKSKAKFHRIFLQKRPGEAGAEQFEWVQESNGSVRRASDSEMITSTNNASVDIFSHNDPSAVGNATTTYFVMHFCNKSFSLPSNRRWRTPIAGMTRLASAERLLIIGSSLRYKRFVNDYPVFAVTDWWDDTGISGFGDKKSYIVQTASKVIERCLLMTTDPGDLVLDPTCGSGTTAYVAEQWGRRWLTIDTSRVALAIARQRLLTSKFDHYRTKGGPLRENSQAENPGSGFKYKSVPHITLKSIAQNTNLDPIFSKHEPILDNALTTCNTALAKVDGATRTRLKAKLTDKQKREGNRSITDADQRRWNLPQDQFEHWTVPFDTDTDWPKVLQDAVVDYRKSWRAKMDEVNACIAANADQEELVDQPEVVKNVVRVSGPFTVEGVNPEELSLSEDGLFDPTPNEFEPDEPVDFGRDRLLTNLHAYLTKMIQHLRADGLTFLNNQQRKFARIEPLFENSTGSFLYAEGVWEDADPDGPAMVAITFGPQYGPVTAQQVEEAIRSAKRYDELVVAGFSFDAEATQVIADSAHPKLRIHQAYIRPDINPAMEGLLKDTPGSQLFTVFGQPDVSVSKNDDGEWVCTLHGVDIYNPVENTVKSTGADKVASWFLDSDYDGRSFCVTQAFFPDQDAWEKIAKALKGAADPEAFAAFKGTVSLPFSVGKHRRIAVKVIDPRGNEVMAVRRLEE